jgi:myosin heavy subunit
MKKALIAASAILMIGLAALVVYLLMDNRQLEQERIEMQELAELDKQEMENDYERLSLQYSEMMTQINNDSIIAQLTQEQMRTQQLLEELKKTKAEDAREITRLKKELATVRAVLRDYVMQIDSLNRQNEQLRAENSRVKDELAVRNTQIAGLSTEKATLSEKVAIASQLDATNIQLKALKKNDKDVKKIKDCKTMQVSFTITRNVTATNGNRTVYVRIQNPGGNTLNGGGTFPYENRNLQYTMKKNIEYTGEETNLTLFWQVSQMLEAGDYRVSIFVDGNMIGSRTFSFN